MSSGESLRDVMRRGVELQPCEAVAIAQQLIASAGDDVRRPSPLGPLSLDTVHLGADGSVACERCIIPPSTWEIGMLLAEMLPHGGTTRVPGALRYTIARALSEVEAPPFDSIADLSAALGRHEQRDRVAVVRDLYARAAAKPATDVATEVDRRRRIPAAAALRRQLREADQELFFHQRRPVAMPPAPQPAPSFILHPESAHVAVAGRNFTAADWIAGAIVALLISFGAGYTVVARARASHVASPNNPGATSAGASATDASRRPALDDATPPHGTARRSGDPQSSPAARRRGSSAKSP